MALFETFANTSTESLLGTQYLSVSRRGSAPASPMSSTFFDSELLARSISPVPSNYALYTRSRPTSTDSSFFDFQSFVPVTSNRPQVSAAVNESIGLMDQITGALRLVEENNQISPMIDDKASFMSKQTTRSRVVRRSDVVPEAITEGEQGLLNVGPKIEDQATTKKKNRRFLPKFLRRAMSTSGALNAQILDRKTAFSKPGPGPLTPSSLANTVPSSGSKAKGKAHSMFRFRVHQVNPSCDKPVQAPPPPLVLPDEIVERRRQVRRSGSFAGFSTSPFAPSSPVVFRHHGLFSNTCAEPVGADGDEDELDALTLEATALSAQIGQRWMYAED
ncbi:hypothetical protein F5876DRAFT_74817 [Lentinula aff. lateritia]|uniref:Uncharacterized protein n=1 Tax=Lentinula aff. lateritia TaxID=2804960 RepID=A0ACC1U6P3_9AGAR|nr:hypothetical protein F5876DRAFT_74817 [Lentinula aff. lateritia]